MTKLTIYLHDGTDVTVENNGFGVMQAILRESAIKIGDEEIPFHSIVKVKVETTADDKPLPEDDFCIPYGQDGDCAVVGEAVVGTDIVCGE